LQFLLQPRALRRYRRFHLNRPWCRRAQTAHSPPWSVRMRSIACSPYRSAGIITTDITTIGTIGIGITGTIVTGTTGTIGTIIIVGTIGIITTTGTIITGGTTTGITATTGKISRTEYRC
jgi:hypothetical protein